MRRSHRAGAATVATAGLLTGAAVALAALHGAQAPAEVTTGTVVSEPTDPDLDTLTASADRLRREAAELKAELADRVKAEDSADPSRAGRSTGSDADPTAGPPSAAATGRTARPTASPATSAPITDVTTGASGASGGNDEGDDGGDEDPASTNDDD
jgi:hypothetical protein